MLVIATLLGNLVMLLMYLYENLLAWIRYKLLRKKEKNADND